MAQVAAKYPNTTGGATRVTFIGMSNPRILHKSFHTRQPTL